MTLTLRCAAAALSLFYVLGAMGQTAPGQAVTFVAHSDRPIITLERTHGMVRGLVERPLLYIYGDGLVRVDRPAYMINSGEFEYRLEPGQLAQLIGELDRDGVMNIDGAALQAERDAAVRATGERFFTTDSTVTRIKLDFASYARAGAAPVPLGNTLRYSDLQIDALRFPQIQALAALARAEKRLLALIDPPLATPDAGANP